MHIRTLIPLAALIAVSCAAPEQDGSVAVPSVDEYCRVAQRIVTRTEQPVELRIHESFDGFVKSKAIIPAEARP